jgi:hypothetical protein
MRPRTATRHCAREVTPTVRLTSDRHLSPSQLDTPTSCHHTAPATPFPTTRIPPSIKSNLVQHFSTISTPLPNSGTHATNIGSRVTPSG